MGSNRCNCLIVTMALLAASSFADEANWRLRWRDDAFASAREAFTDRLYEDLCPDGEDAVPIRRVMVVLGSEDPTPRQLRRLLEYDPSGDGRVDRDEMYHGLTAFVFFQVERHMSLDADGDGKLSREEHALQVPDYGARRDDDGFVKRQRDYFDESDLNGDGAVTRKEVVEGFSTLYVRLFSSYLLGFKAASADTNDDGCVDLAEYAALNGRSKLTDRLAKEFDQHWPVKDGKVENLVFHDRFSRMSPEERDRFEKVVQPFWEQHGKE